MCLRVNIVLFHLNNKWRDFLKMMSLFRSSGALPWGYMCHSKLWVYSKRLRQEDVLSGKLRRYISYFEAVILGYTNRSGTSPRLKRQLLGRRPCGSILMEGCVAFVHGYSCAKSLGKFLSSGICAWDPLLQNLGFIYYFCLFGVDRSNSILILTSFTYLCQHLIVFQTTEGRLLQGAITGPFEEENGACGKEAFEEWASWQAPCWNRRVWRTGSSSTSLTGCRRLWSWLGDAPMAPSL